MWWEPFEKDGNGFNATTIKVESEKVTKVVGTFLKEDSNGFKASSTKVASEKVYATVTTFLIEDCNGL
jgi:hypothetical protein